MVSATSALASRVATPTSVSPGSVAAPPMARTSKQPASLIALSGKHVRAAIQPVTWRQIAQAASFVAAAPDGTLWALATSGPNASDKYIFTYSHGVWTNVEGAVTRLSVGPDNTVWAVNAAGGIYRRPPGQTWLPIAGGASDVTAAADGSIFVISNQGQNQYGYGVYQYAGGAWTQLPGAGVRVAASWDTGTYAATGIAPGGFYVLNALGSIYYYTPQTSYVQQPGTASELAVTTSGGYFILANPASVQGEGISYRDLATTGGYAAQPGAAIAIATTAGLVYVVGSDHMIYQSPTVTGRVLWQTGSGATGQFLTPGQSDGQCPSPAPVVSGRNISFTVLRNTNGSYTDGNGHTTPGTSTCWRNQVNPVDPNTNTNLKFTMGQHYTFFFQTVVTLNGNTYYGAAPDGNYAVNIPAIIWQTHSWGENPGTGPCDMLDISNTRREYNAGYTGYGTVTGGGRPIWTFHTCSDPSGYTGPGYYSPDFLYDGEVDNWQIDIDAQYDTHGGHVTVRRDGAVVYDAVAGVCDNTAVGCWWNFGPYMYFWQTTEKPSGFNEAGVTINVNNMTLTTP
ncbi:MAG TPA: tectonin domain-containing protein [Candidatus Elarobacter sp.]